VLIRQLEVQGIPDDVIDEYLLHEVHGIETDLVIRGP
jgi:hypothetical protein